MNRAQRRQLARKGGFRGTKSKRGPSEGQAILNAEQIEVMRRRQIAAEAKEHVEDMGLWVPQ